MMQKYFLSLGSDMGDRLDNLRQAVKRLSQNGTILGISSVYETMPVDMEDNAFFLNCVLHFKCDYSPQELLTLAKKIEGDMGRIFSEGNIPRPIDIDIILWSGGELASDNLTIPHPRAKERRFVTVPLNEISPGSLPELDLSAQFVERYCGADKLQTL